MEVMRRHDPVRSRSKYVITSVDTWQLTLDVNEKPLTVRHACLECQCGFNVLVGHTITELGDVEGANELFRSTNSCIDVKRRWSDTFFRTLSTKDAFY